MSDTQASLESGVTAAQSGLGQSESPPVLSPIVSTAEQRRADLSLIYSTCRALPLGLVLAPNVQWMDPK